MKTDEKKQHKPQRLSRPNLVQEVVDWMQQEIVAGRYAAGEKLPSEGQLCESFGVSRTVIREAVRCLDSRGLIDVAQGRAAHVREADPAIVVDSLHTFLRRNDYTPHYLLEVRRALETEAVALAAQRATPEQIEALRKNLQHLAEIKNVKAQVDAEITFHQCLAEATNNPLFPIFQQALTNLMSTYLTQAIERMGLKVAYDYHAPIVEAIARHDADAARKYMHKHLVDAESKIQCNG